MKDNIRIKELYRKLIQNRISSSELDEFLDLLDQQEGQALTDAEMKILWDQKRKLPLNEAMKTQIWELQERAKGESVAAPTSDSASASIRDSRWRVRRFRFIGGVAAGLLLLIALFYFSGILNNEIEYHTSFGEREKITLPDGSMVELNANTTLVWDKRWKHNNIRRVRLDGEAFFEVLHTSGDAKFIVYTDDLDVEVLGTSFNVSNRHQTTEVFLEEGSVKLGLKGNRAEEVTMIPGQKVIYSVANDLLVEEKAKDDAASWKNDVLYFNDKTVEEILLEVSALYGVEFSYSDPEIKERKLNFWVPYTGWESTKEAFELTMNLTIVEKEGVYEVGKK